MNSHHKAYVCVHVFNQTKPILLVNREGGDWCFLCGEEHEDNASEYRVVGIGHLFDRDASLGSLVSLLPDWEAERSSLESDWILTRCHPDS